MRHWLLLATIACAAPPSDAVLYHRAVVTAESFEIARDVCSQIRSPATRSDCAVTITERFDRRDEAACDHVDSPVWKDECTFLLAERLGAAGSTSEALTICVQSRFRRHCAWHLLQDAVEASVSSEDAEAERQIALFRGIDALPDVAFQFWRIRWTEQPEANLPIDERRCAGLRSQAPCESALQRYVQEQLEAAARLDRSRLCSTARGERVRFRGVPKWRRGPLTDEAEAAWESRACGQNASDGPMSPVDDEGEGPPPRRFGQ